MGPILYCGIKTVLKCMGQFILPVLALLDRGFFSIIIIIIIKRVPVSHQTKKKTKKSNVSVPSVLWILHLEIFLQLRKSDLIFYDTDAGTVNSSYSQVFLPMLT